jgi:hypothetical protein
MELLIVQHNIKLYLSPNMKSPSDIDQRLEVRLVDGIIYSFQEQMTEDQVMLDGFWTVVNALGKWPFHIIFFSRNGD